jgi:hypothetical protein
MQRAVQRKTQGGAEKRRMAKPAPALRPTITDLAVFYADILTSDRYLPVSSISNTTRDAMLARGLVTPERLRARGVR